MSTTNGDGKSGGGWFRVQDAAVAKIADVGPLAFSVYCVLAKHAGRDGYCWPSFSRLAALCGATRRGVQKAIARLVQENMILKEKRADTHGGLTSNRYRVLALTPQGPGEPEDPRVVNQTTLPYGTTVHQGGEPKNPRVVNQEHQEPDPLNQTQRTRPKEPYPRKGSAASPPAPTRGEVCDWWNGMHSRKLVGAGVDASKPSEAVQSAWKRVQKSPSLRALFQDLPSIERAVESGDFVRQAGWLTLAKLLGGRNKDREFIIEKLLDGAYRDGNGKRARVGAGQRFDPSTANEERQF